METYKLKTYELCIVTKEYRYITVGAENESDALDQAWAAIESILNRKAEDYDTDIYVEGEVK